MHWKNSVGHHCKIKSLGISVVDDDWAELGMEEMEKMADT